MKKILFTINYLTNGGPTRVLENIIKGLSFKEYEIYILTIIDQNEKSIVEKLEKKGVKIIAFSYSKSLSEVLKNKKNILTKIYEINPDIIHTHGIVTTMVVYNTKLKSKKVTTIHNNIFEDYRFTYGKVKGILYSCIHIFMLRKFNEVICCSKTSCDLLKKYLKNVDFIRNGIDIDYKPTMTREKIREELNIKNDDIVYVYGGVINKRKRVCELVELFNENLSENEYLIIVGDGELKNQARELAKNKHIIFVGFKTNIIDYFKASDIYVSNSSSEGFSISIIEALESNLLLLLSDIPSHKECFQIDESYYIGEYFNTESFVDKKNIVYKNINKNNNILEFKNKYLSSEAMVEKYKKIY